MRFGNTKIFNNKVKLYSLINLRKIGFSLDSLATLFNCDRMAIEYHVKRYRVAPDNTVYDIARIVRKVLPKPEPLTYKIVNGEKINLGRDYKDYLKVSISKI